MKDESKKYVAIPNESHELLKRLKNETDLPMSVIVKRALILYNQQRDKTQLMK